MQVRILSFASKQSCSPVSPSGRLKTAFAALVALQLSAVTTDVQAQTSGQFLADPDTGMVYQKQITPVDRAVVETKLESKNETIMRPRVVTETKPESRTVYTPNVEYRLEPRVQGRFNPFKQPTVVYQQVPHVVWEARNEVVQRSQTRTEWVAENRTVQVPRQHVTIQRQQNVEYQPVGQLAPATQPRQDAFASRLRPLDAGARVIPLNQAGPAVSRTQANLASSRTTLPAATSLNNSTANSRTIASSVGRMTSDPPRRNRGQGGMRATELMPSASPGISQPLTSGSTGVGIARVPSLPIFR